MEKQPSLIKYLIQISRPRFWMYVFGPALIGLLINIKEPTQLFQPTNLIHLLYFLYPANLLIYGINDICDGDTDKFNDKKGKYEVQHTSSLTKKVLLAIALTNIPFLIYLSFQNTAQYTVAMLAFLFFSIQYSAKPIRAKAKPILDGVFNVLYILPALTSLFLAQTSISQVQIILLLAATFWCMSMHAFSAIPDIEADTKAGLTTTAVLFQTKGTLIYCGLLYFSTFLITLIHTNPLIALPLAIYPIITAITYKYPQKTFKIYKYFPYINTLTGFMITIQIIIHNFL